MKNPIFIALLVFFSLTAVAQTTTPNVKYRRSSLFTLMIDDSTRAHADAIKEAFLKYPVPDKFNDHNLKNRLIKAKSVALDQQINIDNFIAAKEVSKNLVAKWFDRNKKGGFDMNLISERGSYNASEMDVNIAKMSKRGTALLQDAGEELIKNTFVLISDFKYTPDSEIVQKAKEISSTVKDFGSRFGGNLGISGASISLADAGISVAEHGKGYVIKTTSYLYRLDWNDSVAAVFYNDYWMDSTSIKAKRKTSFDSSGIFTLTFIGKEDAWATVQTVVFANKSEDKLVGDATVNAVDAVIAKLQRGHEEFRTKTQLITTDPATAKIGLKEGLQAGDRYDVLQQTIDEEGRTTYPKVGVITVDKKQIWDNRFNVAAPDSTHIIDCTLFKGGNKKMYPGMLIKQK